MDLKCSRHESRQSCEKRALRAGAKGLHVFLRKGYERLRPRSCCTKDTNNRDDVIQLAEELSQESAMYRLVFACIVLVLMTQGAWAESKDHARLISAVSEFKQVVADSIDLNTNHASGISFLGL